jgi:hypothetical protein
MSVDERLRHTYRRDEPMSAHSLATSYDAVVAGSRRRRRRHRVVVGAAALSVLGVAATLLVLSGIDTSRDLQPAPPGPSQTTTDVKELARGLDGTWRSLPLTRARVAAGLRDSGLTEQAADYVRSQLPEGRFRVVLTVSGGIASARVGDVRAPTDRILLFDGNRVELRPSRDRPAGSAFSWALNGETLSLHLMAPDPADVDAVATYTLTPFVRFR